MSVQCSIWYSWITNSPDVVVTLKIPGSLDLVRPCIGHSILDSRTDTRWYIDVNLDGQYSYQNYLCGSFSNSSCPRLIIYFFYHENSFLSSSGLLCVFFTLNKRVWKSSGWTNRDHSEGVEYEYRSTLQEILVDYLFPSGTQLSFSHTILYNSKRSFPGDGGMSRRGLTGISYSCRCSSENCQSIYPTG